MCQETCSHGSKRLPYRKHLYSKVFSTIFTAVFPYLSAVEPYALRFRKAFMNEKNLFSMPDDLAKTTILEKKNLPW